MQVDRQSFCVSHRFAGGATLTLKCRESEDNAPSVKSQGLTIAKKTISDLAATEKIGLRFRRKRKNLSRKPAGVFEIEILDQISLSSLSRHLRVKMLVFSSFFNPFFFFKKKERKRVSVVTESINVKAEERWRKRNAEKRGSYGAKRFT